MVALVGLSAAASLALLPMGCIKGGTWPWCSSSAFGAAPVGVLAKVRGLVAIAAEILISQRGPNTCVR